MEMLLGFLLGRATRDASPVELIGGFFGAMALIVFFTVATSILWQAAPLAEQFIQWCGIGDAISADGIHIHDAEPGASKLATLVVGSSSRLLVCAVALNIIVFGILSTVLIIRISWRAFLAVRKSYHRK